jgi:hypothetical protein
MNYFVTVFDKFKTDIPAGFTKNFCWLVARGISFINVVFRNLLDRKVVFPGKINI